MSESPSPTKRHGRPLRFGVASLVLLGVAGYLVVQYDAGAPLSGPGCRVVSAGDDGATYEFTPEQAVNAATITAVGTERDLPERAVTIALATALQESALRNIDFGDRDSLGLFQQRPSQGWGTPEEVMDPLYSAGKFYDALEEVAGYTRLPLTVAAQRVQLSGFPQAYAKHEPDAALLAAALTGRRSAAVLTCVGRPAEIGDAGTDTVRDALALDFGRDSLEPAGPGTDEPTGSSPVPEDAVTSPDGRTVTLPVSEADSGRKGRDRGWQLAHWAVANASSLRIERVSYAGEEWAAGNGGARWNPIDDEDGKNPAGSGGDTDAVRITTA